MTIIEAILLGFVYWLFGTEIGYGLNYPWFMQPLTLGPIVGLILGDVMLGLQCGALIAPMYLAFMGGGGVMPNDKAAAGIVPTAMVIAGGLDINAAIALAIPVGLLCAQLHTLKKVVASTWAVMADKAAAEANPRKLYMAVWVFPQLFKVLLYWVPISIICYFGTDVVSSLMNSMPQWLLNGLSVVGGVMPAIGMAVTVNVIGKPKLIPFFLAGFFLVQYTGIGNIALALVGLFLTYLYMTLRRTEQTAESTEQATMEPMKASQEKLLSKRDVAKQWLLWTGACETVTSFDRLQGVAFGASITPALRKLYGQDKKGLAAAMQRHLQFYNTSGNWGGLIGGMILALEEQRAMGTPVPDEAIEGVKVGLMGPMAGIGDTVDWATVTPLLAAFFIPFAQQGFVWAPFVAAALSTAYSLFLGLYLTRMGYRLGTNAATKILSSGTMQTVILFFGVLGLFMLGGLSAGFVNVQTPILIPQGQEFFSIQHDLLDPILPGVLSLGTVMGAYLYLRKKGNVMKLLAALLFGSLILGCLGILGTPTM